MQLREPSLVEQPEALHALFLPLHAPVAAAPTPAAAVEPAPVKSQVFAVELTRAAGGTAPAAGCPQTIIDVFGENAPAACAVSLCESGWDPDATGAQGEMGWFQVHPRYHHDATYDPLGNTLAAYRISSGGTDWSQWTCKPGG